ncbi:MAG: hypothetical protein Fur0025_36320 [Oscillatoriaceae cyanobacterium]
MNHVTSADSAFTPATIMSTALIFLSPDEIKQVQRRTVNPSRFFQIEREIRKAAVLVTSEWSNFSAEQRDTLQKLAYELIEPPTGAEKICLTFWSQAFMLYIKLTGQEAALTACIQAVDNLIDNILDAIEREEESYQKLLSDSLVELERSNWDIGESVNGVNYREWVQQLSNQALAEIRDEL